MLRFLTLVAAPMAIAFKLPINVDSPQLSGRRAALAAIGSVLATPPLAANAALFNLQSKVTEDEVELEKEKSVINGLDNKINSDRRKAFTEELTIKKTEDLQLAAIEKNDWAEVKRLEAIVSDLKKDEKKLAKEVIELRSTELNEVMKEKKLANALAADKKILLAAEDTAAVTENEKLVADCMLTADDFEALPAKEQKKLIADGYNAADRAKLCGA